MGGAAKKAEGVKGGLEEEELEGECESDPFVFPFEVDAVPLTLAVASLLERKLNVSMMTRELTKVLLGSDEPKA